MDKFFAVFGKTVVVIVIIAALAGGGYYLGKSGKVNLGSSSQSGAVSTTNPTPEPTYTNEASIAPSTTSATVKTKTVTAGVAAGSGLSFAPYTVQTPDGWTTNHESDASVPTDSLTLTKGEYTIKIYQAASGGSQCVYAGDPAPDHPFASPYDKYTDITGSGIGFRRSSNGGPVSGKMSYTICQKSDTGTYGTPTSFGHVSITTPATATDAMLKEIDGIIGNLKKS